ncbi:helix-turn-helix domain-containing protein [Helicobacter ganmani]|uniref:helix-turn-helix domain-containing protein n=1 Tax=Helicobacter ganmani TaxID=60246 RepID=UPI003A8B08CA
MELDTQTIGKRIKERRKTLGLTQLDIKTKVGISSGNISDIERGNRLPAATTLVQLAQVLECSIDYILTGVSPDSEIVAYSDIGESAQKLLNFFYTFLKKFVKIDRI